ncbi:hypothetical protein, partial [Sinorhizobium medicae]
SRSGRGLASAQVEMPSVVFLMAEDVSKVTFQLCAGADISTLPPQIDVPLVMSADEGAEIIRAILVEPAWPGVRHF